MRFVYPIIVIVLSVLTLFFAFQSFGFRLFNTEPTAIVSKHDIVLEKIEALGKLELVKYKFRDVLEHKLEYDYWFDSKAILIISGEAVGCIDLKKIKKEDVRNRPDTVYIQLPAPELCYYKVNHEETRIYDTQSYSYDKSKLIGGAFQEAEKQIKRTALQSNILQQTRENGERLLKPMFEEISGKKVVFTYQPQTEDKSLPKR
ncbi:MAG: hypothetical protein OHK0053_24180 [Microscillaceae bacterium]